MAWTYSGDPAASDRDMLRFRVGDTDTSDQQFTDAELDALLAGGGSVWTAAIAAVEALTAKYARKVDRSLGDLSISHSQRLDHYAEVLQRLRKGAALALCAPYAGGISQSDKDDTAGNTDRVPPAFSVTMHQHPGTLPGAGED